MPNLNPILGEPTVSARQRAARALPWLVSGSLLLCLVLLGGQGQPPASSLPAPQTAGELRAEKLVIVDSDGRQRAELGVLPDGNVGLMVRTTTGQAGAWVGVEGRAEVPRLALRARDGRVVAEMGLMDQTTPVLVLRDPSGQRRITAWVTKDDNEARVDVLSKSGKSFCSLRANVDGSPRLVVRDEEGRGRILLGVGPEGSCALDLADPNRTRFTASVTQEGDAGIVIFDKTGSPVWWHSKPPQ